MPGFPIERWRTLTKGSVGIPGIQPPSRCAGRCFYRGLISRNICHWGSSGFNSWPLQVVGSLAAGLIAFNKYLMNAERFPYAKAMTATWICWWFSTFPMGNLLGLCVLLLFGGSLNKFKAMHMLMTTLLSLLLYTVAPSLYPSMDKARENWRTDTWRMTTGVLSGGSYPEGGYGSIPMWVTRPNASLRLTSLLGFHGLKFKD